MHMHWKPRVWEIFCLQSLLKIKRWQRFRPTLPSSPSSRMLQGEEGQLLFPHAVAIIYCTADKMVSDISQLLSQALRAANQPANPSVCSEPFRSTGEAFRPGSSAEKCSPTPLHALPASFQSDPQTQKYKTQSFQHCSKDQQDTEQFLPTAQQRDEKRNRKPAKCVSCSSWKNVRKLNTILPSAKAQPPGSVRFGSITMTVSSSSPARCAFRQSGPEKS